MEKSKLNELKNYYGLSKAFVATDEDAAFSTIWCREASQVILDLIEELEAKPEYEYEYAIRWTHRPTGTTGRLGGFGPESDGWADLDETQLELSDQLGRDRDNGVEADFFYKLLRRRLPGEVEVYVERV